MHALSADAETALSLFPILRHVHRGRTRVAATPLSQFLRPTGLPSRSAPVAPPLRLDGLLACCDALLREAIPGGAPFNTALVERGEPTAQC